MLVLKFIFYESTSKRAATAGQVEQINGIGKEESVG